MKITVARLAACILMSSALLASGQDKPKDDEEAKKHTIDFTQPLRGFDGKVLMESDGTRKVPLTLRDVCLGALNTTLDQERNEALPASYKRGDLIRRIETEGKFPVEADEITLILDHISDAKVQTNAGPQPMYTALIKRIVPPLLDPVKYKP